MVYPGSRSSVRLRAPYESGRLQASNTVSGYKQMGLRDDDPVADVFVACGNGFTDVNHYGASPCLTSTPSWMRFGRTEALVTAAREKKKAWQEVHHAIVIQLFNVTLTIAFGHVAKSRNSKQPWFFYFVQKRDSKRDGRVCVYVDLGGGGACLLE